MIAMTAHAMVGDRQKTLDAGMNDYITKPLDVDKMFLTMAKWISPAASDKETGANRTETNLEPELPALPGIHVAAGLNVTQNDIKLYRKLLLKFLAKQANFAEVFQNARTRDDLQAAAMAVHTLKGVAGNLGMTQLHHAAHALELAVNENAGNEDGLLQDVVAALEPVLKGLKKMKEDSIEGAATAGEVNAVNAADEVIDLSAVKPLIAKLTALLAEGDIQSGVIFENLVPLLKETPFVNEVTALGNAIEAYEFEQV